MAKAQNIKGLAPKKSLEECARKIITTRFHEMMSSKAGVIKGRDIEYIHDMRVASRRLSAAMQYFADGFTPKKKFRLRLRYVERIASTLGNTRNLADFKRQLLKIVSSGKN